MRFSVVCHLVAHPGGEQKLPAIRKLGVQFPLQAEQDMSFFTPMVG
jgi:hypothetical protein